MDAIAGIQIIKLILMMLAVIIIFLCMAYLVRFKFRANGSRANVHVLENIYLNNKDRLLKLQVKDQAYLIFINPSSCLLLGSEKVDFDENQNEIARPTFQSIISSLYTK